MNDFSIAMKRFSNASDKAIDWFLKSYEFEYESDEWKICRLKARIYKKEAITHLDEANKYLDAHK